MESRGGTIVNGQRITEQHLKDGDVVQIGGTQLRVEFISQPGLYLAETAIPPLPPSASFKTGTSTQESAPNDQPTVNLQLPKEKSSAADSGNAD
jgi:pSer/pThr/pTyr-binding forkhead associated (FHA) protein